MNALLASNSCDRTGVAGIACGRHGGYAPNALVDLFKGEQQKNVDFALLAALKTTGVDPDQGVLLIYDIACQYSVHLIQRIDAHLPFGLKVETGIGLFHVHAHKDECFFRYAPSFIPGAGVVAGEILESLWSTLNSISPTARTAMLAHRAEMLDDHATDSNHKKLLGIVSTLCKSNRLARDMVELAKTYYENLTTEADPNAVEKWKNEVESAEEMRVWDITVMDIYATRLDTARLASQVPASPEKNSPLIHWMKLSLAVEEKQYAIYLIIIRILNLNVTDWKSRERSDKFDVLPEVQLNRQSIAIGKNWALCSYS